MLSSGLGLSAAAPEAPSDVCTFLQVMLWKYPDSRQLPVQVETEHQGNIFGVRFLPHSGDRQIVTGAMDHLVQLHTLEAKPSAPTPRAAARPAGPDGRGTAAGMALLRDIEVPATVSAMSSTKSFACHRGRVKVGRSCPCPSMAALRMRAVCYALARFITLLHTWRTCGLDHPVYIHWIPLDLPPVSGIQLNRLPLNSSTGLCKAFHCIHHPW